MNPSAPKLLQGERVEVRQREKGLRGSWHSAVVVGLKPGRRLVEYDELLTEDGLHKLREYIPVTKCVDSMTGSACRATFSSRHTPRSLEPKNRGFLRPLPPHCTEPSLQTCKKGFSVDVFFQDAWWEAVLLDDIVSLREDFLIHVVFPDEGDEERVSPKNLRISQEWDEDTGLWSVKGNCNLSELLKSRALRRKKICLETHGTSDGCKVVKDDSDVGVKGSRAVTNQSCQDASHSTQGRDHNRNESCQALVHNVRGNPSVSIGKDGKFEKGQAKLTNPRHLKVQSHESSSLHASSVVRVSKIQGTGGMESVVEAARQLSCSEWGNEKEVIITEPEPLACSEYCGGVGPNMEVSNGLPEVAVSCRKEEATREGSALLRHPVTKVGPQVDGDISITKGFINRGETDECTVPSVVKSGGGEQVEPYICSFRQEGGSDTSSSSVFVSSLQEPVDGTNTGEQLGFGMLQWLEKVASSNQNSSEAHNGIELLAKETDVKADKRSQARLQQTDPHMVQQSPVLDEVGGVTKKACRGKSGRSSNVGDGLAKMKVTSNEELFQQGLMRVQLPPLKGKGGLRNNGRKPMTKMKDVAQAKDSRTRKQYDNGKGSDNLKQIGRSAGKLRPCQGHLTRKEKIAATAGNIARTGGRREKDKISDSVRLCSNASNMEGTSNPEKKGLKVTVLKSMVRKIAKEVLLQVGFKIEFRPRDGKECRDVVYVSPSGSTYWSLPKAWQAWKKMKEKMALTMKGDALSSPKNASVSVGKARDNGTRKNGGKEGPTFFGAKAVHESQGSLVTDREDKRMSLMIDQDMLLQAALEEAGGSSVRDFEISQDNHTQSNLTNSQLANLFLDLDVLKRTPKKDKPQVAASRKKLGSCNENKVRDFDTGVVFKASKSSLADNIDAIRGRKRKRDNQSPLEKGDQKILSCRLSLNREQREYRAVGEKTRPFVPKKGGDKKLSSENRPPTKLGNRQQVKQGLGGASSKKCDGKVSQHVHTNEKKPFVKRDKSGRGFASDRPSGFEIEGLAKELGTSKEKSTIVSKKQSRGDFLPLLQPKGKKSKLMSGKQPVSYNKKGKNQRARSGFRLEVRTAVPRKGDESEASLWDSERTVLSWMIDRGAVTEREKLCYVDSVKDEVLKEGVVTRQGIFCRCCKKIYAIHSFKVHAGSHAGGSGKNIIFASGRSLLDCQLQAWAVETQLRKIQNYVGVTIDDRNDDTCLLCGDGGDLLCCDHCPSTFHMSCLHIQDVPEGSWYCPRCRCAECSGSQHNDKDKSLIMEEFVFCSQCEHHYHTSCLRGGYIVDGNGSFCGHHCQKVFSSLKKLIGECHPLDGGFSWTLLRHMDEDYKQQPSEIVEVIAEQHSKLAVALLVMQECFVPMDDPRTNIDMLTHVVYNRCSEFDRLNYGGFYTVVLEREDEIISAASIRVYGGRLAEMPLIGTRQQYRRQGMCRLLVGEIEKMLDSLQVANFVLPAIPELLDTWTHAFGFRPLDASQRLQYRDLSMMVFPGTELLQKPLTRTLKADILPVGNQLLQQLDSSTNFLESDGQSAGGPKAAKTHVTRSDTLVCFSDLEKCRQRVSSPGECAPSRCDRCSSESGLDFRCAKEQELKEALLSKRPGNVDLFGLLENATMCKEDGATKLYDGTLNGCSQWSTEAVQSDPPVRDVIERSEAFSQGGQEHLHCGLKTGSPSGFSSMDSMISVRESQDLPLSSSEQMQKDASVCKEKRMDESNDEMRLNPTHCADMMRWSCIASSKLKLSEEETQQQDGGTCRESPALSVCQVLDKYVSQTYGRKRRRQVVSENSALAVEPSTAAASLAMDRDDSKTPECLHLDDKVASQDYVEFTNLNVEPSCLEPLRDQRHSKEEDGCVVSCTSTGETLIRPQLLCS